jgi:hypothetical protein
VEYHSEPITRNLISTLTVLIAPAEHKEKAKTYVEAAALSSATKEEREGYFRLAVPTLSNWGAFGIVFAGLTFVVTLLAIVNLVALITLGLTFAASMFVLSFLHNREVKASAADPDYMPYFTTGKTVIGFLVGLLISLLFVSFVVMPILP